jgi:hypothetical protein
MINIFVRISAVSLPIIGERFMAGSCPNFKESHDRPQAGASLPNSSQNRARLGPGLRSTLNWGTTHKTVQLQLAP